MDETKAVQVLAQLREWLVEQENLAIMAGYKSILYDAASEGRAEMADDALIKLDELSSNH